MSPSVKIIPIGTFDPPQREWYQIIGNRDVYKYSIYTSTVIGGWGHYTSSTLYWSGKRWVAWIAGVLVAESTEFMDYNDPPLDWAEGVLLLSLGD